MDIEIGDSVLLRWKLVCLLYHKIKKISPPGKNDRFACYLFKRLTFPKLGVHLLEFNSLYVQLSFGFLYAPL